MAQKTPVGVLPDARFRLFFDVVEKGGLGFFFRGFSKSYPHSVVLLPAIRVKYRTLSNTFVSLFVHSAFPCRAVCHIHFDLSSPD